MWTPALGRSESIGEFDNNIKEKDKYQGLSDHCPIFLVARRKLRMIAAAKEVKDLRIPPGNNLEQLAGNLAGLWSIRINDQWRIVFTFENGGADNVRITDYH